GFEAYKQYCRQLFATLQGPIEKMEFQDLRIVVGENVAYAHAIAAISLTMPGGDKTELGLPMTAGLRRINGAWLITQEQMSISRQDAMANLVRSRKAANEASAVGSLRTLNVACVTYSTTYGIGFPEKLSYFDTNASGAPSVKAASLVDSVLASGTN